MGVRRSRRGGAGIAAVAILLTACGGGGDDDGGGTTDSAAGSDGTASASAPEGADGQTDATLTVAIASDIGSLDPQSLAGTGGGNLPAYGPMFGGGEGSGFLASLDPETNELLPGVAESWEVSEDQLTWTVTLRDDVVFHNGETLTSEDVKFSVDRMIGQAEYNPDFQSGSRAQFEPIIDHVEAVDPVTVVFHLQGPDVTFLLRPLYLVPKAYVEEVGDQGFADHPIGIGPFKFVSWDPGNELVLERFDDYHLGFDSPAGIHPPYIKTLVQRVIPEDGARLAALQAGEVDMAHNVSADIARQLESDDNFQVFYMPGTQPMWISVNTDAETAPDGSPNPWRDARVREAANLAVDVDTIIGAILTGQEKRTFGSASSGFGFPDGIEEQQFQYDPDRARELLAEAGYEDGFETTMFGPTGRWPNSRPVMEAVAEYLDQVGISSTIQEMQYQEFVTREQERTLPGLSFFGCTGGSDPGNNFRYCYYSEGNFANGAPVDSSGERDIADDIDARITEAENTFDRETRGEMLSGIIEDFYLNPRHIWLYEPVTVLASTNEWAWDMNSRDLQLPEYWNIRPAG